MRTRTLASISLFLLSFAPNAYGSCGSSSSPLHLHALGLTDNARLVFDLSFQYIAQERLRHQRGNFAIEHDELRTINHLTTLQISSLVTPRLQLSITAPYVSRTHEHVEDISGSFQQGRFGAFRDAALQARYAAFP